MEHDINETNSDPSLSPEGDDAGAAAASGSAREVKELKEKLLRAAADYQNLARRSQQNVGEARDQALGDVAKALVTVMDHFDRALEVDNAKVSAESLRQGVQMVHAELLKVLEKFGIQKIEAKPGEEFDPKRHAALMRQKTDDVKSGHVAAQFQPGYTLNDRTIRPVQVSVAE